MTDSGSRAGQPERPAAANIPAPRLPAEAGGPLPAASPGGQASSHGSARLGQGFFLPPEPVRGVAGPDARLAGPGRREFLGRLPGLAALVAAKVRDAVRDPIRISEGEAWDEYERQKSTAGYHNTSVVY